MKYVEKLLPMGMQIKAKVTRYEKEPKVRIILSTEKKEFEKYGNAIEEELEDETEQNHLDLLIKSVAEINVVEEKIGDNEIKLMRMMKIMMELTVRLLFLRITMMAMMMTLIS